MMRANKPDWTLGLTGDTWTGEGFNNPQTGVSAAAPQVYTSYGSSTARPIIISNSSVKEAWQSNGGTTDFNAIVGWELYSATRDPNNGAFSGTDAADAGFIGIDMESGFTWFLVEDCFIHFYAIENVLIQPLVNKGTGALQFRRNVVADSYSEGSHSQGIFVSFTASGLIEENVFDHNGWNETIGGSAGATVFNHNIYNACNNGPMTIVGNTSGYASANGMQGRPGGSGSNNLTFDNAVSALPANCSGNTYSSPPTTTWQYNVFLEGANRASVADSWGPSINVNGTMVYDHNISAHSLSGTALTGLLVNNWGTDISAASPAVATLQNFTNTDPSAFQDNEPISFNTIGTAVLPTGLTVGTTYYVKNWNSTTWTFNISATPGGSSINTTGSSCSSSGPNDCGVQAITDRLTVSNSIVCDWNGGYSDLAIGTTSTGNTFQAANCTSIGPNPTRTLGQYYASIGNPGGKPSTTRGFMDASKLQSKANWVPALMAKATNCYFQAGLGMTCP
jgi:hypothetical protein